MSRPGVPGSLLPTSPPNPPSPQRTPSPTSTRPLSAHLQTPPCQGRGGYRSVCSSLQPLTKTANKLTSHHTAQAFVWTSASLGWYLSLLWGLIYASDIATNKGINGIWTGTSIKLFNVISSQGSQISLKSPKGAVDYVGDSIARRISNFSFSNSPEQTMKDV